MSKILILTGLIAVATAIESDGRFGAAPAAFGFDSTDALTPEIAGCLKNSGYSAAFFRIFSDGHGDMRGVENAVKASEAGIKLEFFVTPRAVRGDAKRQLDLLADFANQQKIGLKRVWLQVTSPHNWQRIWGHNVEFINDFITAGKARGIKVGLFTNWYDYEDITDHSRQVQAAEIWYWHAISEGPNGETSKDFRDFRPFGPFKGWPLAKQYGVEEKICNYNANVNVFPASSMNSNGDNSIPIGEGAAFVKSN